MHVALLGDSILDNGQYTDGGPAVTGQLQKLLGSEATVTLLAVDGSITRDTRYQVKDVPPSATHLVLSVGGNDALQQMDVLSRPAKDVGDGLCQFAIVIDGFTESYARCLDAVLSRGLPTIVCAIYNGWFTDPAQVLTFRTAVQLFNDVIIQTASDRGCPIIDLRRVCNEDTDYWNPIEPNSNGGAKVAAAIAKVLIEGDFTRAWIGPRGATDPPRTKVRP